MEVQYSNILKIHKLSKAQYDAEAQDGSLDAMALYLVPEENLTIQLNGGTTEGTNKFTYNGSIAKSMNITYSNVGAAAASHTHGNITNDGKLGTASVVVVTDSNKNITTSSTISTTELGYLNGVTSNIQTQLDGKLNLSGGTMTGNLLFNQNASIQFTNTDSAGTDYTNYSMIQFFSGDANGAGILIGGGGYVGVGSGESAAALKTALSAAGGTEQLHLSSDQAIYLHANCQTIGNRKTVTISTAGDVSAVSFTATSDKRLKENIKPYICDKSILDLEIKKFDFINGSKNQIGCLAQELQEICPELVKEGEDGYLSIHESKLVYLLLQELKKQNNRITDLEAILGGK